MPDSVMTEPKELTDPDKDNLLDDLRSTVASAPWYPEGPMTGDIAGNMDDMPPLETFGPAPYTSPVHGSFLESDALAPPSKDIVDGSAQCGIVGLRNLGNTCFLNAGLQCLASNSKLVQFFLEKFDMDEMMVSDTLTGAMADVIRRMWSGRYLCLQPTNFKHVLATYHPQFKDFRQHDCQEFLALLLDSLHEQLNVGKQWHSNQLHNSPPGDATSSPSDENQSIKSESTSSQSDPGAQGTSSPPSPLDSTNSNTGPSCSQSGPFVDPQSTPSGIVSEDSNHSESSLASDITITADDMNRRLAPIPESLKRRNSSEDYVMDKESQDEFQDQDNAFMEGESETQINNRLGGKRLPSIEDFMLKGTKTLNTNVLAASEDAESVTVDSGKFHKPDNSATRATDPYENLSDILMSEVKVDTGAKPLKETNLLANVREKFPDYYTKKCLFNECQEKEKQQQQEKVETEVLTNPTCSINNIKRMKIDEDEKNIRMQAKLKVNTNKNPTKPSESDLLKSPVSSTVDVQSSQSRILHNEIIPQPGSSGSTSQAERDMWEMCVVKADQAWNKYKECNQSVIVDTFQGQFKSTVVCSECHHISVTYEPFMYLSVPLPHAMERQISVVFVPCDTRQPIRYLLTMHKHDNVKKIKLKLRELIEEESCDIIVAEVFDNHISRILEDNTLLKYVNETNRTIFAFEMLPPPQVEEATFGNDDASTLTGSLTSGSDDTLTGPNNLVSSVANNAAQAPSSTSTFGTPGGDVFSNMGAFSMEDVSSSSGAEAGNNGGKTVINNQNNTRQMPVTSLDNNKVGFEGHSILNNLGEQGSSGTWTEATGASTDLEWQDNLIKTAQEGMLTEDSSKVDVGEGEDGSEQYSLWKQSSTDSDVTSGEATWGTPVDMHVNKDDDLVCEVGGDAGTGVTTDQWKSCAICLDEMADRDLMVHTACGGTLCQGCLEMSYEHYGEGAFMCPVCSSPVSPTSDFLQLNAMADYKPKTRILPVPVVQRYDTPTEGGQMKGTLFGHPGILYLPSHMTGEFLYESVDRVVSCLVNYTIHLTDGQGYHCSRCMYTEHCSGCEISREAEVTLQPGDHLAIHFTGLGEDQVEVSQRIADHKSMKEKRPDTPLTLTDCFNAFMDSEVLDEHNPWFCPCCKKNQCANKTMSVWRYPQTLVVYLKRFVFHELSSTKIDNKVVFPLNDMNLNAFNSGPKTCDLLFDLHGCVCHFGGVNAGHYTSYARNPHTSEWFYYNDETFTCGAPTEEDYKNTYILFYQQQGTDVKLDLTHKKFSPDEDVAMTTINPSAPIALPYQPSTLNNDAICQILDELDSSVERQRPMVAEEEEGSSHGLDFYS